MTNNQNSFFSRTVSFAGLTACAALISAMLRATEMKPISFERTVNDKNSRTTCMTLSVIATELYQFDRFNVENQ